MKPAFARKHAGGGCRSFLPMERLAAASFDQGPLDSCHYICGRLHRPKLAEFVFDLGKIVHTGSKFFFRLASAYRYRDAAVFCEISRALAISAKVRSFQIFMTNTSLCSLGKRSSAATSARCDSSSISNIGWTV